MSKENANKGRNILKQPKLTAFIASKSNESSPGMRENRQIIVNMFVIVNLNSRIGKKNAKTSYFVSAIPDPQTSSSITSDAHSSTSAATATIDSTTVNLNVTLNVTSDDAAVGK